jgi:hypothetical protein
VELASPIAEGQANVSANLDGSSNEVAEIGTDWAQNISAAIGRAVQERRRWLGLEAKDVERLTEALGYKIQFSVLSKIETGARKQVSVPELIVLARALGTTPALLMAPIAGGPASIPLLPGDETSTAAAYEWMLSVGADPEGGDPPVFTPNRRQRLEHWWALERSAQRRLAAHQELVTRLEKYVEAGARLRDRYRERSEAADVETRDEIGANLAEMATMADAAWESLVTMRDEMRIAGMAIPPLSDVFVKLELGETVLRPWSRPPELAREDAVEEPQRRLRAARRTTGSESRGTRGRPHTG